MRAEANEGEKTGVLGWEQKQHIRDKPKMVQEWLEVSVVGIERWKKCDDKGLLEYPIA